ncbi:hypothetical protein C5E08_10275 [Rathayibacter iranicus]|uniref:Uncharacterized protein n=1 Tax=Rathayibacter iranicus TaxID=59737 RepID=A0AAD1AD78_9MICO|nr:hypothetical protein C7V51_10365 [Rathayibacter iranicus]PPI46073.1 hypothetical protein C5E09_09350 [Rathayibacter iranicus]PPI59682.1 hypothetical protein C5E08_10275 [Rathayibacter iranicus]
MRNEIDLPRLSRESTFPPERAQRFDGRRVEEPPGLRCLNGNNRDRSGKFLNLHLQGLFHFPVRINAVRVAMDEHCRDGLPTRLGRNDCSEEIL